MEDEYPEHSIPEYQPPAQIEPLPAMSEDEVLAFTRGMRIKAVNDLTSKGEMPAETSDRIFFKDMLNGLDSQAIGIKRIAADTKENDNTTIIVAEILKSIDKRTILTAAVDERRTVEVGARTLPDTVDKITIVEGEMDVEPPQMDFNTFMTNNGRQLSE